MEIIILHRMHILDFYMLSLETRNWRKKNINVVRTLIWFESDLCLNVRVGSPSRTWRLHLVNLFQRTFNEVSGFICLFVCRLFAKHIPRVRKQFYPRLNTKQLNCWTNFALFLVLEIFQCKDFAHFCSDNGLIGAFKLRFYCSRSR